MEHLMLKEGFKPTEFPVYSKHEYDRGDFATFPQRSGWNFKLGLTAEQVLEGRSRTELASFLQTWLFFGYIDVFFGYKYSRGDFVRINDCGEHVMTTYKLGSVIQEWNDQVDLLGGGYKESYLASRVYLCMVVRSALEALNYSFGVSDYEASDMVTCETSKAVLPVHILHETLLQVFWISYKWFECPYPSHNVYLASLLLKQGWCEYNVKKSSYPDLDISEQCYILSLGGPNNQKVHASCSSSVCKANQVESTESYEMKHVTETCQCVSVAPCQRDIIIALESGHIPLVCIQKTIGKYHLEVVKPKSLQDIDYIAISHVWADGLGAFKQNSLYQCQVESLDRALQDITKVDRSDRLRRVEKAPAGLEEIPIWMDTFCIPVEAQYSELRKMSIMKMREIYKKASSVLVLDGEIRRLSTQVSPIELVYRFILSGWEQRLWTFQEGYLARRISFLALDGAIPSSSMLPSSSGEPLHTFICNTAIERMKTRFHKVTNASLYKLVLSKSRFPEVDDVPNTIFDILILLVLLNNRKTSKREDETIVLANILNIPNGPLQQIADPEARMVLFLQTFDKHFGMPLALLFSTGSRLSKFGFRWAPSSFVRPIGNIDIDSDGLAQLSETGTHLTFEHSSIEIAGHPEPHGWGFMLDMPVENKSDGGLVLARYQEGSSASFWVNEVRTDRKMVVVQAKSIPCRGVLMEVMDQDAEGRSLARYCCCLAMGMVNLESWNPELREPIANRIFKGEQQPPRRWIVE
jgi:hypothetical protein